MVRKLILIVIEKTMPDSDAIEKAKQIKQRYEKNWLSIEGVTAVGVGFIDNDHAGIIVSVHNDIETARKKIPGQLEGVRIKIQKTGEFRAQ